VYESRREKEDPTIENTEPPIAEKLSGAIAAHSAEAANWRLLNDTAISWDPERIDKE
jgi:hypothetical protein